MMTKRLLAFCMVFVCLAVTNVFAGASYRDHQQLTQKLRGLADKHPDLISLQTLGKTVGGKDIWLLSIGAGDITKKPAIAMVGGVSGDHLLGTEIALGFAERLALGVGQQDVRALLDSVTFYIVPDVSPDARAQFFAPLRYERFGNANPSDLDRDGRIGEDPYDDLNGDGLITLMRIKDPTGKWIKHPDDERVMVKANMEKGERGQYLVFSEGVDNDKDGQFNEDGEEGIFFNKNFTFDYPVFDRGAGEHPVSEIETRAIADFLFGAKNVFAVVSFGPANNLTHPLSFSERNASGRIITGWLEHDATINRMVSHTYHMHVQSKGSSAVSGSPGDFFQWAYFHYGRFSFSTPGWWVPPAGDDGKPAENAEVNFLRWAEKENIPDVFVPWTRVDHPDFPGQEAEVGGIAPFVMKNPPEQIIAGIADNHYGFLMHLAAMRPRLDIVNVKTEQLGRNLFRISVDIANTGAMPATSQLGQRVRWVQKPVVRLELDRRQELISGRTIDIIQELQGHSSTERSWLVRGGGTVTLRAGSESAGFKQIEIKL